MNKNDEEKSNRHDELEIQFKKIQAEHNRIYKEFYSQSGKVSAEDLIEIEDKLREIQQEWRKTLTLLRHS